MTDTLNADERELNIPFYLSNGQMSFPMVLINDAKVIGKLFVGKDTLLQLLNKRELSLGDGKEQKLKFFSNPVVSCDQLSLVADCKGEIHFTRRKPDEATFGVFCDTQSVLLYDGKNNIPVMHTYATLNQVKKAMETKHPVFYGKDNSVVSLDSITLHEKDIYESYLLDALDMQASSVIVYDIGETFQKVCSNHDNKEGTRHSCFYRRVARKGIIGDSGHVNNPIDNLSSYTLKGINE